MKTLLSFAVATCALTAFGLGLRAQVAHVEPISMVLVPNQEVTLTFPNEFDLIHSKLLTLDVVVVGPPGTTTPLQVRFDWLDPSLGPQFSPPTIFNVVGGAPFDVDLTFLIPFCPAEVSVDFLESNLATWPLLVTGTFTHECLVPETTTLLPAGVGLLATLGWAWRRRR